MKRQWSRVIRKQEAVSWEKLVRSISSSVANKEYLNPKSFEKIRGSIIKQLNKGGILVPAFWTTSWKIPEGAVGSGALKEHVPMDQRPCDSENRGCSCLNVPDLPRKRYDVEPSSEIEFPVTLETIPASERNSNLTSEVGYLRIDNSTLYPCRYWLPINEDNQNKVLEGLRIWVLSVCEKLGPRYASIPTRELNKCRNFYEDLLSAFQKYLRNCLEKTHPNTEYHCLNKFESVCQQDIQLPVGTTIDFHQTSDGNLITERGNHIGTFKSKELCRAFFDMYIVDVLVSEQTKEEISQNVAGILRRC